MTKNKNHKDPVLKLTKEQRIMLVMGEEDIKNGRLISEEELDREDLKMLSKSQ